MTPFGPSRDDATGPQAPTAAHALEELHDEPIDLEVGDDEEVGLDAASFEEGSDAYAAELLPEEPRRGAGRLDDEPFDPGDCEEALSFADGEYGLRSGIEPADDLDDDFDLPSGASPAGIDDGENGLLDDDDLLDLAELPPLPSGSEPPAQGDPDGGD